jgi:DNA-binding response OmpR family regulator
VSAEFETFTKSLTTKESGLVALLLEAQGTVVPRAALLTVLGRCAPRTLDTYAKQIRTKMRAAGLDPAWLKTHTGKGYSFLER